MRREKKSWNRFPQTFMSRRDDTPSKTDAPRRRGPVARFARGVLICVFCIALGAGATLLFLRWRDPQSLRSLDSLAQGVLRRDGKSIGASLSPSGTGRVERPYGMVPVAFGGFVRACAQAGVNPDRIGQTIGDHPLSAGYHKRDGTLELNGEKIDYCAAVDLGVWGLSPNEIARFSMALQRQGFATFYRHGGKWKDGEHIHAIYALLPMKPQLREQVREFLQARRDADFPRLKWEKKLRLMRKRRDDVP